MIDFRNKLREALEVYATEIDEYLKSLKGEKWYEYELFKPHVWGDDSLGLGRTTVTYLRSGIVKRELHYLRRNELLYDLKDLPEREHIEDLLREDANERHGPLKQGLTELLHLAEILRRVPSLTDFTTSVFESEFPVDIIIDRFIVNYYSNYRLEPSPQSLRFQLYVSGIKNEETHDTGIFRIRKPIDSDFPYRIRGMHPEEVNYMAYNIDSVVEWEVDDIIKKSLSTQREIERMIRLLHLGVGGNWISRVWRVMDLPEAPRLIPEVDTKCNRLMKSSRHRTAWFTADSASWFRENGPFLLKLFIHDDKVAVRLRRATEMYQEALFRKPEESVLFAVIGLESLYSEARSELRIGVSQRVSVMINQIIPDVQAIVFDDVYEAYDVRSKFVHGDIPEEDGVAYLSCKLCEYLRISILVWSFLRIETRTEMGRMNKLLQRSLVDSYSLKELQEQLSESIGVATSSTHDRKFIKNLESRSEMSKSSIE